MPDMKQRSKPRALKMGDRVGLVAPAGPAKDAARLEEARSALASLGFEPVLGASCHASYGYLAGRDDVRAADLNAFFADPGIAGIVCLKGGYGTPRILDRLDYEAIGRTPKIFLGYSDITGIHLAIDRYCGFPTFHGPMPSSDMLPEFDEFSRRSWLAAVTTRGPLGLLPRPEGMGPSTTLVPGTARGRIVGGNLSLIAASMGTPYEIDTRGRILFIEEVHERPFRVDRMLNQLRLAGKFAAAAGIVLGSWKDCGPAEGVPSLSLEEVFADIIAPAKRPTIYGFPAGHESPSLSFPLGVEAELDAEAGTLGLLESATLEG